MNSWDKTSEKLEEQRARLRKNGSRWMQLGPGETVEFTDRKRYDTSWASGDLWVGYRVLAGDAFGLHLVTDPFDGYVYAVSPTTEYRTGALEFEKIPAELLDP